MDNSLLAQIQAKKKLKKVAEYEKNDKSEVKGAGAIVGAEPKSNQSS
jgi:hypothetical protein